MHTLEEGISHGFPLNGSNPFMHSKIFPMSCLENVISVRNYCDPSSNTPSLSGLDLMDAPELNQTSMAAMADADFIKGYDLAKEAVRQAGIFLRNDFLGVLASNKIATTIHEELHASSKFDSETIYPAVSIERGFVLHKSSKNGKMKKLRIRKLYLNAADSAESATIKIYDNGKVTSVNVSVDEGLNEYDFEYEVQGQSARIVLAEESVPVFATKLLCHVGCDGKAPNDCGYTKAWNGSEVAVKEAYGLGVDFSCFCDYDSLLCGLSKTYIGNLLYLKSRIILLEKRQHSTRLNDFIIYGEEEAKELRVELINEYNGEWNTFVGSLPNILKSYRDDCLDCRGIKWQTNI